MANDLGKMTRKQLEKLQKDVEKALKSLEMRDRREAKKAAEAAVAKFGFKLNELTSAGSAVKSKTGTRTISPPKYANPADPEQTWTGKGRQPNWYRAEIERGTAPEAMEIKD